MRVPALLAALLMLTAASQRDGEAAPPSELRTIAVTATPVPLSPDDPAMRQVGRLRYMGGLWLKSGDPRFGGLSGLRWREPGRLVSITDGGQWVTLDVREEGGRLAGLDGVKVGLVRGPGREPMRGKAHADAEALELVDGGYTVAFETLPRIWHYRDVAGAAFSEEFPDPDWLKAQPANRGIEAMARMPGGWIYMGEAVGKDGMNEAIIAPTGGLVRRHARVKFRMPQGYAPTDAQALDEGHVLIVGRHFSIADGVSAIVAIVPVDLAAMTIGTPQVIASFAPPLSVDNMEGLTIARDGGHTYVYLCSDDNFSPIQRTLLLKFELLP